MTDNNTLDNLTLSKTFLKPGQETNGHSHENQEEIYFFVEGNATMIVGEEEFDANPEDVFIIQK